MDVDIRAVEAYARVKAILARIDGIHTANQERQRQGLANAYGPEEFFAAERDLEAIADSLKSTWKAIHIKTGNEYTVTGEATNATNAQDGQPMVIYEREGERFVRSASEFLDKFKVIGGAA